MRAVMMAALAGYFASATLSYAEEGIHAFGYWQVTIDRDAPDGKPRGVAGIIDAVGAFAVRCIDGSLSLVLIEHETGNYVPATHYPVKVRVGVGEPRDADGLALNDRVLKIDVPRETVEQMAHARSVRFHVVNPLAEVDRLFQTRGAGDALAPLLAICPGG